MNPTQEKTKAIESAFDSINEIPSFYQVWCESCEWETKTLTPGEIDVRAEIHGKICDGEGLVMKQKVLAMDGLPDGIVDEEVQG